jgi:hypothetical protein
MAATAMLTLSCITVSWAVLVLLLLFATSWR